MAKSKSKKAKQVKQVDLYPSDKVMRWSIYGIGICSFLLYFNTLFHDFTLDDAIVITQNEFTQKGFGGIIDIFSKDTFHGFFGEAGKDKLVAGGRYRPFTLFLFAIEKGIFGSGPFIHHLINVLLYSLTCMLLFLTGFRLFQRKFSRKAAFFIALASTIIYLVHPLHTEAVANIKGRDEIMAFLGSLFALYVLVRKSFEHLSTKDFLIAGLGFFISLLSKENAITFLLVIPLAAYLFYEKSISASIKLATPFLLTAVLFIIIRTSVIGFDLGAEPSSEFMNNPYLKIENNQYVPFETSEKLATISFTLAKYVQLLVVPYPLTHDYYPSHISLKTFSNPYSLLGLLFYLGLLILSIIGVIKKKVWAFFPIYYLATISIVSNIFFPIGTHMSERFMYMPSLAYALVLAYLIHVAGFLGLKSKWIVVGILGLALSVVTISRNRVWKDNLTLFTTDARVSKNSAKVNNAAGGILSEEIQKMDPGPLRQEYIEDAHTHLDNALKAHPNYVNAYLLKGNIYFYDNKFEEAINMYNRCLGIDPSYEEANKNIFLALRSAGRYYGEKVNDLATSAQYLEKALAYEPNDFETNRLLGTCYGIMGNHVKAVTHFKKCSELEPNNAAVYVNLGKANQFLGNQAEALRAFEKARSLDPNIKF